MSIKKHTVADGDTLSSIAAQYHLSVDALKSSNNLSDDAALYTGAQLSIPQPDVQAPAAQSAPRFYTGTDVSDAQSTLEALKRMEASMPQYTASDALNEAQRLLEEWTQNKPDRYVSSYEDQIASLIAQLQNRPSFSYDPSGDPLYNLYREHYERQGRLAMLDSEANAAALTGGYANSYAVTAASQAYQNYLSGLGDKLPSLYEQAYDRWQQQGQALADQLALYRDMDKSDYDRWRDGMSDYYEDLSYYYNRYNDMSRAEYDAYQDDLAAWQADRDYWYQKAQDEQAQANWQAQFALSQQKAASSSGRSGGGGRRSSSSSGASSSVSSNYNTFLNGLKETVRIDVLRGKSKSSIYSRINNQVNEFLSNSFITAQEAKQMRAVAQSYYAAQYRRINNA